MPAVKPKPVIQEDPNSQSVEKVVAVPPQHEEEFIQSMYNPRAPMQQVPPIEQTGFYPSTQTNMVPHNIYDHEAFRSRLWRAYKGASIYEVAKVWSDEAEIDLIWNAPRGMALKETISVRAPFANVIEQLLSQYNHEPYNLNGIMSINKTHNKPQLIVISR